MRASELTLSVFVVTCALSFAAVGRADGHALVETGIAQVNDAAFEDALSSFDAAWSGSGLSRDDLIALLAQRAVANFALRASAAVDRDLGFLAAIDRGHTFARHVPPPMRDRFEQIRKQTGEPSVSVLTRFAVGRATLDAEVHEMPRELVREVRLFARPVAGAYVASAGTALEVPNPEEHAIEWYVEVVGPGDAVLLREGEAEQPRRALHTPVVAPLPMSAAAHPAREAPREPSNRSWRWWAIGGGTAAAAVATTVAVLLVREPAQTTQVSSPVLTQ